MKKKTILFSLKEDWKPVVLSHIDLNKYAVSFEVFTQNINWQKYDLIIPFSIHDQQLLNHIVPNVGERNFFSPPNDIIELADNKSAFNAFLIEKGWAKHVPEEPVTGQFPYILKAKKGEFGRGCYIIRNVEDEKMYDLFLKDKSQYYTQQIVVGEFEYTTHIFFYKKIIYHCSYEFRYPESIYVKGGNCEGISSSMILTPFLSLWNSILSAINYEGLCCFNYKIKNGVPLVFEMNPRYGSSLLPNVTDIVEAQLNNLPCSITKRINSWR